MSNRDAGGAQVYEIYVMDADGGNPTRLTTSTVWEQSPTWSPDGTRIAFATSNETFTSIQVYSMAADGTNPRRLTKRSATNWFPDWQAKP